MRSAVLNADEFRIDPAFSARLRSRLQEGALSRGSVLSRLFGIKVLVPAVSMLLLAVVLGYVVINTGNFAETAGSNGLKNAFLTDVSHIAAGDHKDCALGKLETWEAKTRPVSATAAVVADEVSKPLLAHFGDGVEVLHSHDCIFEGKRFAHVILRQRGHIVSVFFDKSEVRSFTPDPGDPIVSEQENGLQVASFISGSHAVFLVSDLSETENLDEAGARADGLNGSAAV
jgi:hypothetical protein